LQAITAACLLGIGGFLVISRQLTLGQLVASELIVAVVVGAFAKLGKHMESYYDLLAACDKLGHLLDLPIERATGIAPQPHVLGAQVHFHRVQLQLSENRRTPDVTLVVKPGERVALSGPAGSGKSSLLELLYGLREAEQGYVEFDSVDLRSLSPPRLREQVALVNSTEILEGTLAENVHLHREHVDHSQVRTALEAVGMWEEVMSLESGLETRLSVGGGVLSNSQAIRLMLARAIAGRPRLILIDSILDQLSEPQLHQAFEAISAADRSMTAIVVTSRESLLKRCDRVAPIVPAPESTSSQDESASRARRLSLVSM
jgi:ABC-type bacteriocin/lantibiotic exporter with double-glycine peptidase domain